MATYAIGDVQGCYDELKALLKKLNFNPDADQLWFCGDLINRGPKSLATLELIHSLRDNCKIVLGNHDLHLLATAFYHRHPGRKDTIHDILDADDAAILLNWLRKQPLVHFDKTLNLLMVHAGLHPDWSMKQIFAYAKEVETVIQGEKHIAFYKHMYGDKPLNWSDTLSSWSRYRFITNIFTRLRYCDKQGKPALGVKSAPGTQAEDLMPWFDVPTRMTRQQKIIFGHWSTLPQAGKETVNNTFPLDSGCLWGGQLTAMRIDDASFEYIHLDCPGAQKPSLTDF